MFDEPIDPENDPIENKDVGINNGYASVKPDNVTALKIVEHLKSIGINDSINPEELHVTLMYSKNKNINIESDSTKIYSAMQTGKPEIMGNDPYRALVIKLDSDELHGRFVELLLSGAEHSYPDFTPHLSLKYSPTEQDLKLLQDNPIQIGDIKLTGEVFASTKN